MPALSTIVRYAMTVLLQPGKQIRIFQPWMTAVPVMYREVLFHHRFLIMWVLPAVAKVVTTEPLRQVRTRQSTTCLPHRIVISAIPPLRSGPRSLLTKASRVIVLLVTMVHSQRVNQPRTSPPRRIAGCATTSIPLPAVFMITRASPRRAKAATTGLMRRAKMRQ